MTKEEIVKILEGWEFGAKLSTGEYVRGVKKEYFEAIANDILYQVKKNGVLDNVGNSDNEEDELPKCCACDDAKQYYNEIYKGMLPCPYCC